MNIKQFTNDIVAADFVGVSTTFAGMPKELRTADLPAQWVEFPSVRTSPDNPYSTFTQNGSTYTANLIVAVSEVVEGTTDAQRNAVLDMAVQIELWATNNPQYTAEVTMTERLSVAAKEYRGVIARITAGEYVR